MPSGVLVSYRNLKDYDLNSLFGFIEGYVVYPNTIKRPFLPYQDKNKTLICPTGEFLYFLSTPKRMEWLFSCVKRPKKKALAC